MLQHRQEKTKDYHLAEKKLNKSFGMEIDSIYKPPEG